MRCLYPELADFVYMKGSDRVLYETQTCASREEPYYGILCLAASPSCTAMPLGNGNSCSSVVKYSTYLSQLSMNQLPMVFSAPYQEIIWMDDGAG